MTTFFQKFCRLFFLILFTVSIDSQAQSYFSDGLTPEFHKERRQAFRDLLPEKGVAVIFNNPVKNRSNDTEFNYRPNSDFYYLTGFREPNAALIIFKNPQTIDGAKIDEIIYVQPRDARREQWDGVRLGVEGVKEKLGFEHAYVHSEFMKSPQIDWSKVGSTLSFDMGTIEGGSHNAALNEMVTKLKEMSLSSEVPGNTALNQIMSKLRVVKTPDELVILEKAIVISGKGHIESFKSIKPGVSERAVQGVHEFVHKSMGAEDVGYGSIVGSGNNSTILHYVENNVVDLNDGLVLMDIGAEYRGYSGDITRTVPVKGVFSPEEQAIYEIVLESLEAGIAACKAGADYQAVDNAARKIIDDGLVKLGLVKQGEKHPYFPHGVGHHLGLDVHDRGGRVIFEPGMVLTVEPGIYIPEGSNVDPKWWKIGVRIEDNILITADGHKNLSAFVPKTVEDIERIMKEDGILQKLVLSGGGMD